MLAGETSCFQKLAKQVESSQTVYTANSGGRCVERLAGLPECCSTCEGPSHIS